jgi:hypothetical protein
VAAPVAIHVEVIGKGPPGPAETNAIQMSDRARTMEAVTKMVQTHWRRLAEPSRRTGEYIESIQRYVDRGALQPYQWATTENANEISGVVQAEAEYANIVEEGRGPVRAVRANWLRFYLTQEDYLDDNPMFAKEVGPMEGLHYGEHTANETEAAVEAMFYRSADRMVQELSAENVLVVTHP